MDDFALTSDEKVLLYTIVNNLYAAAVDAGEDPGLLESIVIKLETSNVPTLRS